MSPRIIVQPLREAAPKSPPSFLAQHWRAVVTSVLVAVVVAVFAAVVRP